MLVAIKLTEERRPEFDWGRVRGSQGMHEGNGVDATTTQGHRLGPRMRKRAMAMVKNTGYQDRPKHIDICYLLIWEKGVSGEEYIDTKF
ncbi:hypothetical protein GN244_ATG16190 [Phytophthora infestans]|uniref:Uncharacterized protein n=1 Tax=Phytophthora infestans TaxID=4787 RepID=A0A833SR57_PHYIN|nr:hypothetical protein GN244_ATG16190 [Phytophthora infestans]